MKRKIDVLKAKYETDTEAKIRTEEERKEMAENLKAITKVNNKNKDVLSEMTKLKGQNMKVLQSEVGELTQALEVLKDEWNEFKKPIADDIQEQKQLISDKKVEYQYKVDKIKDIKKEIKEIIQDLEHKKEVLVYYNKQWDKAPKDINRQSYLKRIKESITNLKNQKKDIHQILTDIYAMQAATDEQVKSIQKLDTQVEELFFNEAKKDKVAKEIYK